MFTFAHDGSEFCAYGACIHILLSWLSYFKLAYAIFCVCEYCRGMSAQQAMYSRHQATPSPIDLSQVPRRDGSSPRN